MGHVTRMRLLPAAVSNRAVASRAQRASASRNQPGRQNPDDAGAVAPPRPRKRAVKKPPGTSK
jgi:hypothetical protein